MSALFTLSYVALWILVVLQGLVVLGLARVVHRLQQDGAALATVPLDSERLAGQEAPRISGVDVSGAPVDSGDLAGRLAAVLFVSPSCSSCTVTLDEMHALAGKVEGNLLVVCRGGTGECQQLARDYNITVPVVADVDEQIGKRFDVAGVPTAVLIGRSGRILRYGHPERAEELEGMLQETPEADEAPEAVDAEALR
jgi:methylamine dehydrogenase accessory protein MauD